MAVSVSAAVKRILDSEPSLRECLSRGIVNYSQLARHIKPWVDTLVGSEASMHAIKMAIARYTPPSMEPETPRRRLLEVIARSSIELRSGIGLVTSYSRGLQKIRGQLDELAEKSRLFLLLSGLKTFTIVVDEEMLDHILERLSHYIIKSYRNQAALIVVSPEEIITTPGVVAYITGVLAREGINLTQIESIHTDTILILEESQASKALEVLYKTIKLAKQRLKP
ncbi:MAG: ACT domain-containing protein [Desulfurococcales archaeon]|nr:ACT domain-containing protein [Desulfurococcales archaeon]